MPHFEVQKCLTYFRAFKQSSWKARWDRRGLVLHPIRGARATYCRENVRDSRAQKEKLKYFLIPAFLHFLTSTHSWLNTIATAHACTHYSWTLCESVGSGCVSPCKDHWTNATGGWRFSDRQQQGILNGQSPPNSDKHGQKQAVVFSQGELMVSFLAAYPRHCPLILPRLILFMVLYLDLIPLLLIC